MFLHQEKSAGNSVKTSLVHAVAQSGGTLHGHKIMRCGAKQWYVNRCKDGAQKIRQGQKVVVVGTHVLALQHEPNASGCIWTTMAREPLSRLVSSYFYCKYPVGKKRFGTAVPHQNKDQLCAKTEFLFDGGDPSVPELRKWAKHWRDKLFTQMLVPEFADNGRTMWGPSVAKECRVRRRPSGRGGSEISEMRTRDIGSRSWTCQRNIIEKRVGTNDTEGDRQELLKLATNTARTQFAVTGITTDFAASLARMSVAMGTKLESLHNTHGSEAHTALELEMVEAVKNDPHVLGYLQTDMRIFEAFKAANEEQSSFTRVSKDG